jgi:pyruvate dehydrogenase E1 component alpha subunit
MGSATQAELLELYRKMYLVRRFEEKAAEMYAYDRIAGFLHLYSGEEAIAVGAVAALRPDDDIVTHYRDHAWPLIRGTDPGVVMAELFGKATGSSKGKGGSMHLADVERHFWGGYAIVAGHIPLAVGMALAHQYRGLERIVLDVFGDGATNNGVFHEAMNLAALWNLPVLFLCENNLYGMGTAVERASSVTEMYKKGKCYGMRAERIDGQDVLEVKRAVRDLAAHVRAGNGPAFLEAMTYRFAGHSAADPQLYRDRAEVREKRRSMDPIALFAEHLQREAEVSKEQLEEIQQQVEQQVEQATRFAEESPAPPPEVLYEDVYVAEVKQQREPVAAAR